MKNAFPIYLHICHIQGSSSPLDNLDFPLVSFPSTWRTSCSISYRVVNSQRSLLILFILKCPLCAPSFLKSIFCGKQHSRLVFVSSSIFKLLSSLEAWKQWKKSLVIHTLFLWLLSRFIHLLFSSDLWCFALGIVFSLFIQFGAYLVS